MQDRFTLRFQNGEREGDTVPISSARFTLGRRPGNTLQIQDGSVSGQHAELIVEAGGVLLRDLGSTNGTKVGGGKITETQLAHGDLVTFGSINATFEDAEFLDSPSTANTSAPSAASPAGAGEGVERVSADMVARSGKRSKVALIGIIVILLGGGGAAAYFMMGGGGARARQAAPVVEVAGNKVAGYSFEGEAIPANWSNQEGAPADFGQRGEARASGEDGMRAVLAAGEWAMLRSDPVSVPVGRTLDLAAKLRARSKAAGRVGVEFLGGASGDAPGSIAWGPWVADVTTHQDIRVSAHVPPGCRQARVVVAARAEARPANLPEDEMGEGGHIDVDDVSLVDGSESATPAAKIGEYSFWVHGEPQSVGQLTKVSRTILGDLRGVGEVPLRDQPLSAKQGEGRVHLSTGGAKTLSLRVEADVAAAGVASITPSGYSELVGEFEATGVTTLLLGTGHDLVALNFESETTLRGRREGDALRIVVHMQQSNFELQVDFKAERAKAGDLAFAANNAEDAGQLGECLAKWNELLETVPFEAKLIQEARATRARLEQAGLAELAEVSQAFEQASFFRLVDLYRQCRSQARAVGQKYAGSEVETQAAELVTQIEGSLSGLEEDLSKDELNRLQSILHVLEQTESPNLASEVRGYINSEFGGER